MDTSSDTQPSQATDKGQELKSAPTKQQSHERLLDEAITETFPASDPISPAMADDRKPATHKEPGESAAQAVSGSISSEASSGAIVQDDPTRWRFPTQQEHPPTREERIRQIAHQRFEARGGQHGSDVDDWLAAEAQFDAQEADLKGR